MAHQDATFKLEDLVGKTVLIGITRVTHKEELIEQLQHVGVVTSIGQSINFRLKSGGEFKLPPDISSFRRANPGQYRLRSTGEEVTDPDFTTTWIVRAPDPKDK